MTARLAYLVLRACQGVAGRGGALFRTWAYRGRLRAFGAGSKLCAGVYIGTPERVSIGKGCYLGAGVVVGSELSSGTADLADRIQVNAGAILDFSGGLRIEDDVLISARAVIYTHDHGSDPHSIPDGFGKTIAQAAWIGADAVILHKCRSVGRNAIIGAGAVVTRDVPDYAIMAGNPARQVGEVPAAERRA